MTSVQNGLAKISIVNHSDTKYVITPTNAVPFETLDDYSVQITSKKEFRRIEELSKKRKREKIQ